MYVLADYTKMEYTQFKLAKLTNNEAQIVAVAPNMMVAFTWRYKRDLSLIDIYF